MLGTIGHFGFDGSMGLAVMAALSLAMHSKPRTPRQPTPQEITERDKRTERQRWNDEVAERKAAKKSAKTGGES